MAYSDYGAFVYLNGERPLGKMALVEVLDVIAENPHRFIERYEMYHEEVIRLGGKL